MEDVSPKTTEELPKKAVAQKVVTEKRRYFFPDHSVSIEAESLDDAIKKLKTNVVKDGDA